MRKLKQIFLVFLLTAVVINGQNTTQEKQLRGYNRPEEMVTLSSSIPFSQAISVLSKVSEKSNGRRIVATFDSDAPIGIEITNIPFDKALNIIVQYNGLVYEVKETVVVVHKKEETAPKKLVSDTYAPPDSREVNISAIFFELDVNSAKQRGLDWRWLLQGKGLSIGSKYGLDKNMTQENLANSQIGSTGQQQGQGSGSTSTSSNTQTSDFNLNGIASWNKGGFYGQAAAIFRFFENEDVGNIIASPNITVRDGREGKIQVGTDFSIKQRDFSGNIIDNFYQTGSIIKVTPIVHSEDSLNYILLNINVERSSFIPDPTTTQIRKTSANTQVLMLNGEETVIGGLFSNEETKTRTGVPILKDLPWWVFGLRYVFGTDETVVNKKELVILIKAELVPSIKERIAQEKSDTPMKDAIEKYEKNLKRYQYRPENETKDSTNKDASSQDNKTSKDNQDKIKIINWDKQ